jgi:hypothetical protein
VVLPPPGGVYRCANAPPQTIASNATTANVFLSCFTPCSPPFTPPSPPLHPMTAAGEGSRVRCWEAHTPRRSWETQPQRFHPVPRTRGTCPKANDHSSQESSSPKLRKSVPWDPETGSGWTAANSRPGNDRVRAGDDNQSPRLAAGGTGGWGEGRAAAGTFRACPRSCPRSADALTGSGRLP